MPSDRPETTPNPIPSTEAMLRQMIAETPGFEWNLPVYFKVKDATGDVSMTRNIKITAAEVLDLLARRGGAPADV